MSSPFDKLRNILQLEQSNGFRNRAVIGGLELFLRRWEQEAVEAINGDQGRRQVRIIAELLRGYEHKDEQSRESTVRDALRQLDALAQVDVEPASRADEAAAETLVSDQADRGQVPDGQDRQPAQAVDSASNLPDDLEPEHEQVAKATRIEAREVRADLDLSTPVDELRGISDAYRRRLRRLGVETIEDLLFLLPRRYDDFSALKTINQLEYGEEVTIVGTVWESSNRRTRSGQALTTATFSDATGMIQATWFNQPYLTRQLRTGRKIVLSGRVEKYLGRLTFQSPEWEPLEQKLLHTGRLVPVYPLTKGIGARWMRRLMHRVVERWSGSMEEYLPEAIRERQNLPRITEALRQIHFPENWDTLKAARRRLSFDEFMLIQLGVLRQRRMWQEETGRALEVDSDLLDAVRRALPFELTAAQNRVLDDILRDIARARPMSRLLQGDVGSGKTVVAIIAMLVAVANGVQAALMAPTEILAEQHYRNVGTFLDSLTRRNSESVQVPAPRVRLLTGSLTRAEKDAIHEEIAAGTADIVVGTHALIQETVEFDELGVVTIDEQHRFGVNQRSALRQKGFAPHVLVMTATPIPRTLALTVYGDLDISIIDEMPPGRQEVLTRKVLPRERERAYQFVRSQIEKGRQAFIICPLIEASESIEAKAATEEYERLQKQVYPDLKLGLMHGRLKPGDKEAVMERFRAGELDILVSTSVVEVGIDVPNATVVVIEGADRFGLAQLHQFRGRVGRGSHKSYCLLFAESPSHTAQARLDIVEDTHDGFRLAEEDLKLRGPGEFFGTRQSGLPDLKAAKLSDIAILEAARTEAMDIFQQDPDLSNPEHARLRRKASDFWQGAGDLS